MPELPEVETIRRDLARQILGKKIAGLEIKKTKSIKTTPRVFRRILIGSKIRKIERRGKLMIFTLDRSDNFLLIHLKMTGQLIYQSGKNIIAGGHNFPKITEKLPNKQARVIINFSNHSKLFFNDLRRFGYMQIVSKKEKERKEQEFGLEPLDPKFTLENFAVAIKDKKKSIKTVLMDQKVIAGIGNIYADEICFAAAIKPTRRVRSLRKIEIAKLHQSIKKVLTKAIKMRGTTFSDYRDASGKIGNFSNYLNVYDQKGKKCRRCKKGIITKIKANGRGTHFCPICQK